MTVNGIYSPGVGRTVLYSPIEKIESINGVNSREVYTFPVDKVKYSETLQEKDKTEGPLNLRKEDGVRGRETEELSREHPEDSLDNFSVKKSDQETDSETKKELREESLSSAEKQALTELKSRDSEVRAHEMAHLSAAGGVARGGANFIFVTGPDGQQYAVGGEVGIDGSSVPGDPQATLTKSQLIRRAALAPANPSPQDRRVASSAGQMEQMARIELAINRVNERLDRPAENIEPGEKGTYRTQLVSPVISGQTLYSGDAEYAYGQIVDYFA